MTRTYSPADLVVLPKLDVAGAITVGTELVTAARAAGVLPPPIHKAFGHLSAAHLDLRAAASAKYPATPAVDADRLREIDRALDAAWSAFLDWLFGWSKLAGDGAPFAARARTVLDAVFPDGLKFTQLQYKIEWSESDTRLERIRSKKLDDVVRSLGGEVFLRVLRAAHLVYGQALGVTTAPPPRDEPALNLRDKLNAFNDALRTYVVRVSAHADEDHPATVALANALLRPLMEWEMSRTPARAEPLPPLPDDPCQQSPPGSNPSEES
ncbi:MAG: hypothetical protein HY906_14895 [Deltaproteobacteria bacterium]|nr:hypothetical protein [Deltaproteobacteria bacterium]